MDTVTGQEPEHLVRNGRFGAEALPEHIGGDLGVAGGALDVVIEQVREVIIGAAEVGGQQPHRGRVKQVRPDVVQIRPTRPRRKRRPPGPDRGQRASDRVLKVLNDEVKQLRGRLGRLNVDRHPIVHPSTVQQVDLIVRAVGRSLPARVHNSARQNPIGPQRHRMLSSTLGVQAQPVGTRACVRAP
jgi:hypothetical protein